ncbi:hypothetical protein EYF80_058507 [Liparis tanakae]|uniref:Uncharacterized protein n=1 Tax=Liparis tanakae TaxID=230148 RepID=A0A4Z2ERY0_9TELE|nr:hypothetical protein EYF80_058507 [Liparis tanakae]
MSTQKRKKLTCVLRSGRSPLSHIHQAKAKAGRRKRKEEEEGEEGGNRFGSPHL